MQICVLVGWFSWIQLMVGARVLGKQAPNASDQLGPGCGEEGEILYIEEDGYASAGGQQQSRCDAESQAPGGGGGSGGEVVLFTRFGGHGFPGGHFGGAQLTESGTVSDEDGVRRQDRNGDAHSVAMRQQSGS